MGLSLRGVAAGLLAFALAAGCGSAPTVPSAAQLPSSTTTTAAATAADTPARIVYPQIGVDAPLSPTGLDATGAVAVPPLDQAAAVDYLAWDPAFGKGRPLVAVSHISGRNSKGQVIPGGFYHLSAARTGDLITVASTSGAEARYRVTSVHTVLKTAFDPAVYNPRPSPTLLLITCGGELDRAAHSYRSNVLVEAVAL